MCPKSQYHRKTVKYKNISHSNIVAIDILSNVFRSNIQTIDDLYFYQFHNDIILQLFVSVIPTCTITLDNTPNIRSQSRAFTHCSIRGQVKLNSVLHIMPSPSLLFYPNHFPRHFFLFIQCVAYPYYPQRTKTLK